MFAPVSSGGAGFGALRKTKTRKGPLGDKMKQRPLSDEGSGGRRVDVCVVGAGIAGVAAALRGQELGLNVCLVEAESLLHASCSEGTDELLEGLKTVVVENDFDHARPVAQRVAGAVESLAGVRNLTAYVAEREISVVAGTCVLAIEPLARGGWRVKTSELSTGREAHLESGSVLIATGATGQGGATAAPSEEASAAQRAIATPPNEGPALVVGDGVEAIEVLMSLSDAMTGSDNSGTVYWLRNPDDALPAAAPHYRVGLGDELLATFARNGNVVLLASGSIVSQGVDEEVVVARNDEGSSSCSQPIEVVDAGGSLLQFESNAVFRFERAPSRTGSGGGSERKVSNDFWALLSGLSVQLERQDVGSLLVLDVGGQLSLPGLYTAGDVRGPEYLLCAAFQPGDTPAGAAPHYERVRRAGDAEFSAVEAVASIEAIAKHLGLGRAESSVVPTAAADEDFQTEDGRDWKLVPARAEETDGAAYTITREVTEIGRRGRDLAVPDDIHMADHHASLVYESGEFFIADSGSGSGVWLRVAASEGFALQNEDQVWLGAQILVAAKDGEQWSIAHYGSDGLARDTYAVGDAGIFVGRGSDHELDPEDALLSRRHAHFQVSGGVLNVYDPGSRNGTFVKVTGATLLSKDAEFRIATKGYILVPVDDAAPDAAASSEANESDAGGTVSLQDADYPRAFDVAPGKTLLQGFIEARGREGEPLSWECQTGECGMCIVNVVAGAEHLVPKHPDAEESGVVAKALQESSQDRNTTGSPTRLACLLRLRGDVVIRSAS